MSRMSNQNSYGKLTPNLLELHTKEFHWFLFGSISVFLLPGEVFESWNKMVIKHVAPTLLHWEVATGVLYKRKCA